MFEMLMMVGLMNAADNLKAYKSIKHIPGHTAPQWPTNR